MVRILSSEHPPAAHPHETLAGCDAGRWDCIEPNGRPLERLLEKFWAWIRIRVRKPRVPWAGAGYWGAEYEYFGAKYAYSGAHDAMAGAKYAMAGAKYAYSGVNDGVLGAKYAYSGANDAVSGAKYAMAGANYAVSGAHEAMARADHAASRAEPRRSAPGMGPRATGSPWPMGACDQLPTGASDQLPMANPQWPKKRSFGNGQWAMGNCSEDPMGKW